MITHDVAEFNEGSEMARQQIDQLVERYNIYSYTLQKSKLDADIAGSIEFINGDLRIDWFFRSLTQTDLGKRKK